MSSGARSCSASGSSNQQCSSGNHRSRQGHVGRRDPRRARRGIEPGADREDAVGGHRQLGPVPHRRLEPGHLRGRLHAGRIQVGAPRQHRARGQLHGVGEHRAAGRLGRGDADRHRRIASRRRRQQHGGVCRQPRCARFDPGGDPQHAGARAAHPRDDGGAKRARAIQHAGARVGYRRPADCDRRHARQQPVRQRPVQRLLHERRERAGSHLHHRRRVGGDAGRRPADQQHPERRRQHLLGHLLRLRPGQLAAGRQPLGRGQAVHHHRQDRLRLSVQPVVRRSAEEGRALVLLHLQIREQQDLRPELEVRRWQPGVPQLDGQLQRRRPVDVGGLEQGQGAVLSREAVQRRVLQRLQHPADDHARSVHRCLRRRLGAAGQVDAGAVQQAAVRRRHLLLPPALRAELPRDGRAARPRAPRDDDQLPLRRRRQHDSAVYEHDEELQHRRVRQLRHRHARDQDRHDDGLGHELAGVHLARGDQLAGLRPGRADRGGRRQHARGRAAEGERRLRPLHPGRVDAQAPDAQLRRPLRPLQRRGAGAYRRPRARGSPRGTSRRSRTCRTGTTGRCASPAPTTCSAPAGPRSS